MTASRPTRAGRSLNADAHHVRDLIWSTLSVDGDVEVLSRTEESLAKEYGVSRNAVRLALAMLANEGVVSRRRGIGTSIVVDPVTRTAEDMGMSDAVENGHSRVRRGTVMKAVIPSSPLLRARFGAEAAEFLRWERITYVDDLPYSSWTSYLPLNWAAALVETDEFDAIDMFKLVGIVAPAAPVRATRHIRALSADDRTSIQLGIEPGQPVVHVERSIEDAAGNCLELGFAECCADRFVLSYTTQYA